MKTFISLATASSLALLISPCVFAQSTQGDGVVTLGGEVVDSACGLEAASVDQTIEMTPDPIRRLLRHGSGETPPVQSGQGNGQLRRTSQGRPRIRTLDWEH